MGQPKKQAAPGPQSALPASPKAPNNPLFPVSGDMSWLFSPEPTPAHPANDLKTVADLGKPLPMRKSEIALGGLDCMRFVQFDDTEPHSSSRANGSHSTYHCVNDISLSTDALSRLPGELLEALVTTRSAAKAGVQYLVLSGLWL